MKKNIFFIVMLTIGSTLYSSDQFNCSLCNSFDTFFNDSLSLPEKLLAGNLFHKSLTKDFDDTDKVDQTCALSSGSVWGMYGIGCISGKTCCCLVTSLLVIHNARKTQEAVQRKFNYSLFAAPYNSGMKDE